MENLFWLKDGKIMNYG